MKSQKDSLFNHLYKEADEPPVKTVIYVPNRRKYTGRFPIVSVHKHPRDGRYVVVEQRPVNTNFSDKNHPLHALEERERQRNVYDSDIKFRSVKPAWKWATQGNYIERSFNRSYHTPYLPPLKNRWETGSKVGSLDYIDRTPKGGDKKVPNFKVKWNAEAKVGSLDNVDYDKRYYQSLPESNANSAPSGESTGSLKLPHIKPRYGGSGFTGPFSSIHFVPGGTAHLIKKKNTAKSKVGSLDNVDFESFGGKNPIPKFHSPRYKTEAKVGSLEKIFHKPGGGDVDIIDFKPKWKSGAKIGSLDNIEHLPKRDRFQVPHFGENWEEKVTSKVGSLENADHVPKGGDKQIYNENVRWTSKSKIAPLWKTKNRYPDPRDLEYDEDWEIEQRIREMLHCMPDRENVIKKL